MSEISIDSASTVNRDQAGLKTTHPHSTKQRSQYTLKFKKKKTSRTIARSQTAQQKCLDRSRSVSNAS